MIDSYANGIANAEETVPLKGNRGQGEPLWCQYQEQEEEEGVRINKESMGKLSKK